MTLTNPPCIWCDTGNCAVHGDLNSAPVSEPLRVLVPAAVLRALVALYTTYWHDVATVDPGGAFPKYGLISYEDLDVLEKACEAIEPHEAALRATLAALDPPDGAS